MRRRFYGVFVRGRENLIGAAPGQSVLICANHTNWWDGFVAALLTDAFPGRRVYLAQYEKLLARYAPLRWLGVFGLDRGGAAALPGVRHALFLLGDPKNAVWIFPQGTLVPQWHPIVVRRGALWLARKTAAQVIPVAFRYEWLVESRPSILVNCGEPMAAGARVDDLARTMQALYDDIAKSLKPVDLSGYTPVYRPRMSMNKSWELFTRSPNDREFNPSNE